MDPRFPVLGRDPALEDGAPERMGDELCGLANAADPFPLPGLRLRKSEAGSERTALESNFLHPLGFTQREAADRLHISYPRMNEIVMFMRATNPSLTLVLSILLWLGCTPGPERVPELEGLDLLLIHLHPDLSGAVSLGTGLAESGLDFFDVSAGFYISAEEIAIADQGNNFVHVFGRSGEHRHVVGGEGGGPGEFRNLGGLIQVSNGVVGACDTQQFRLSIIHEDRSRIETIVPDFDGFNAFVPRLVGAMGSRGWIFQDGPYAMGMLREPEGFRRDTLSFVRIEPDGSGRTDVVRIPGDERYLQHHYRNDGGRSTSTQRVILGSQTFGTVSGGHLFVATSDSLHLRKFDADGALVAELVQGAPQETAPSELAIAVRQSRLDSVRALPIRSTVVYLDGTVQTNRDMAERGLADVPVSATLPLFGMIAPDLAGGVGLERFGSPLSTHAEWWHFDPDLRPLHRTLLPRELLVLHFGTDAALVVVTDSLDVQDVWSVPLREAHGGP